MADFLLARIESGEKMKQAGIGATLFEGTRTGRRDAASQFEVAACETLDAGVRDSAGEP